MTHREGGKRKAESGREATLSPRALPSAGFCRRLPIRHFPPPTAHFLLLTALCLVLLAGCGKKAASLPVVKVSGTVTLDGQPLAGAYVQFVPVGRTLGNGGAGNTDAQGQYELMGRSGEKGVPVGEYQVVISRLVMPDGSAYKPDPNVAPIDSPARESLLPCYSDPQQTTLTANVPEGGSTINFPLKSRP